MARYLTAQSSRLGNRKINQDRCAVLQNKDAMLLLVADGLGGRARGELAAQKFIDVMSGAFFCTQWPVIDAKSYLENNIMKAHREIQKITGDSATNPYTTCVCALIQDQHITWSHAGDSRLYLFRDNNLFTRTRDHSYVEDLIQCNVVSESEAEQHPMRNYVTACLGHEGERVPLRTSATTALQNNDLVILCSDGLWGAVPEADIVSSLAKKDLESALDNMTESAEKNSYPSSDNVTAVALRVTGMAAEKAKKAETDNDRAAAIKASRSRVQNEEDARLDKAIKDIQSAYYQYNKEIKKKK